MCGGEIYVHNKTRLVHHIGSLLHLFIQYGLVTCWKNANLCCVGLSWKAFRGKHSVEEAFSPCCRCVFERGAVRNYE